MDQVFGEHKRQTQREWSGIESWSGLKAHAMTDKRAVGQSKDKGKRPAQHIKIQVRSHASRMDEEDEDQGGPDLSIGHKAAAHSLISLVSRQSLNYRGNLAALAYVIIESWEISCSQQLWI